MNGPSPLILVGMHRSGTTMVASALGECGLFMGADVEGNHESLFFQRLNECVFYLAGGRWDWPEPVEEFLAGPGVRETLVRDLQRVLASTAVAAYTGRPGDLLLRGRSWPEPWGFKDPRTTYLLPLWLLVFPEARVLHVVRNGVDVAQSLRKRALDAFGQREKWIRPRHVRREKRWPPMEREASGRCRSLEGAFELWRAYAGEGLAGTEAVPAARRHLVRFEALLADPVTNLREVLDFAGLAPDPETLEHVQGKFRPQRGHAWKESNELRAFYQCRREDPLMRKLGYGDEC